MGYTVEHITQIVQGHQHGHAQIDEVDYLLTDSRKLLAPATTLFFALPGAGRSGADFIPQLIQEGVTKFVVTASFDIQAYENALNELAFIVVADVLQALQQLAAYHRHQFHYPVVGITGSNGKTTVKEWLGTVMQVDMNVAKNPRSYNSQVGVPLSLWGMTKDDDWAIFEAGISTVHEMQALQKMIDPDFGILTYIGDAHSAGFTSKQQKIAEKLLLFSNAKYLLFQADNADVANEVHRFKTTVNKSLQLLSWGSAVENTFQIFSIDKHHLQTYIALYYQNTDYKFSIPFIDDASINNAIQVICAALFFGYKQSVLEERLSILQPIEMRMQIKNVSNDCTLINDSYSADVHALSVALDMLQNQNQHPTKTVILSDIKQISKDKEQLYTKVAQALIKRKIQKFIGVGAELKKYQHLFKRIPITLFYPSTEALLDDLPSLYFQDESILLKGARIFGFERVSYFFEKQLHGTVLEINLTALRNNINTYKKILKPTTKIMAMVKAAGYGSGTYEIANVLHHTGVQYLAVAYNDEGVYLRKKGIQMPIMIMSPEAQVFAPMVDNCLEPEIFSFNILHQFIHFLKHGNHLAYPIHIKFDTGMNRLGFDVDEVNTVAELLLQTSQVKVASVFSHLASSESEADDAFSEQQFEALVNVANILEKKLGYPIIKHISNSAAIVRHPEYQLNMVRLGIGMYGIDSAQKFQHLLQPVATLKTNISQIRHIQAGESVGYNRKGLVSRPSKIATVKIGYADGYPRSLSNGVGFMLVNNTLVPVIGNVCMDMVMLDITDVEAKEGDEVIVFGALPTVQQVAKWANTISYEILTNISQRVKRVYYEE